MVFKTQIFLFFFFPSAVLLYAAASMLEHIGPIRDAVVRFRVKDVVTVAVSLAFYAWACFDDVFTLLFYVIFIYIAAYMIERLRERRTYIELYRETEDGTPASGGKIYTYVVPFAAAAAVVLFILIRSKYMGFFASVINGSVFSYSGAGSAPTAILGISFLSFSAI